VITNEISGKESVGEKFSPGQVVAESLTLKRRIAADETGVRWLARDEAAGSDAELWVLLAAVTNDTHAMDDLRAQVKLNRQLIHPHVLPTRDLIEEEGWSGISTDAVEGDSLAALLKEKRFLDASGIHGWMSTLCQTLDDAHRAGLLHRDLETSLLPRAATC
jgi:serine/threonine protein kinase